MSFTLLECNAQRIRSSEAGRGGAGERCSVAADRPMVIFQTLARRRPHHNQADIPAFCPPFGSLRHMLRDGIDALSCPYFDVM